VRDTLAKYCANRLIDLENDSVHLSGISSCIAELHALPDLFSKEILIDALKVLILTPSFREKSIRLGRKPWTTSSSC